MRYFAIFYGKNKQIKTAPKSLKTAFWCGFCYGAEEGTWTLDLLITNQLRYQLRHAGIKMMVRFGLTVTELQSAALDHLATSSKTECKGFEPLCRDTRRWISNPVQLACSANTPKSRCKNFLRSYPLTELNRLPKLYWLEHCFTSATPHPGFEPGT